MARKPAKELHHPAMAKYLAPSSQPKEGDYPEWRLMQWYILNGHKPYTIEKYLIEKARAFLPYRMGWRGGCCDVLSPYGEYIWHFIVEIEQHRKWQTPDFLAGQEYALTMPTYEEYKSSGFQGKWGRDACPYEEWSRRRAWDAGYIYGLWLKKQEVKEVSV